MADELRWDLSHKHAAVLAGLGEIGLNTLLINPRFGTRLMLASVVTNAPVQPDLPFADTLCMRSDCRECITSCPVKAIHPSGEVDKVKCV